jgi:8-oxo-dGTP pyrophosphatase MutT (NUDIX family)
VKPQDNAWRHAAVMLAIAAKPPHGVLFVERSRHLRRHPGEIGLPGGSADEVDEGDPVKTALRELREELNIAAEHVRVVGELPVVKQTRSRFVVTPIVGMLDAETTYSIDGDEIVGVFAVPLASIVEDGAVYDDEELSATIGRPMYAFEFEGRHIWGFTGRILKSFVDAWTAPASPLRIVIESALHG